MQEDVSFQCLTQGKFDDVTYVAVACGNSHLCVCFCVCDSKYICFEERMRLGRNSIIFCFVDCIKKPSNTAPCLNGWKSGNWDKHCVCFVFIFIKLMPWAKIKNKYVCFHLLVLLQFSQAFRYYGSETFTAFNEDNIGDYLHKMQVKKLNLYPSIHLKPKKASAQQSKTKRKAVHCQIKPSKWIYIFSSTKLNCYCIFQNHSVFNKNSLFLVPVSPDSQPVIIFSTCSGIKICCE